MSRPVRTKLRNLPGNDKCCDCGIAQPEWASITLSSLVCINCAVAHRSLGVVQSRIKSLKLDSWSTPEIVRMLAGGNARLQAAIQSDSARWSVTGEDFSVYTAHARYDSEDADAYRCALDSKCGQCFEKDDDEPPGFGDMVLVERQLRAASSKIITQCVDLNSTSENEMTMFSCISTSFSCLLKSWT